MCCTISNIKDIWFATWINGLLSSPVTHAKNIAGNALFGMWQIPERLTSSILGKGRSVVTGNQDYIQLNEVMDHAIATITSSKDAFRLAKKAFVTNTPTDPVTKLEMTKIGRQEIHAELIDAEESGIVKSDIRPEHNSANYFDAIINTAVDWFTPYAHLIKLVAYGNHETAILKRQETDIIERFVTLLNYKTGSDIQVGGYGGWIRIQFNDGNTTQSFKIKYMHGFGPTIEGDMTVGCDDTFI